MLEKITEEQKKVRAAVKERLVGYIVTALGLVAGLAWNDAIKTTIESVFPLSSAGIIAKFIYAVVLTVFIVTFIYLISKFFIKNDEVKK